jgi:hypothetical protein
MSAQNRPSCLPALNKSTANERLRGLAILTAIALVALSAIAVCARNSFAAPDDEEQLPEVPAPSLIRARINFNRMIFGHADAKTAGELIEVQLAVQVEHFASVNGLSKAQKDKLALAAREDMRRFFRQVDEAREKFLEAQHNRDVGGEVFQEIQLLRRKQTGGLLGEGSLFVKVLHNTLTAEQRIELDTVSKEVDTRIVEELALPTRLNIQNVGLQDVVDLLGHYHEVRVVLDTETFKKAAIDYRSLEFSHKATGAPLRVTLSAMLEQHGLTFTIKDHALVFTTSEAARDSASRPATDGG